MTRRDVALVIAPLPLVWLLLAPVPLAGLVPLLLALLAVVALCGWLLWHGRATAPVEAPVVQPVEVLASVPGVDVDQLLARVTALEERQAWIDQGLDDLERHAQQPPPAGGLGDWLSTLHLDEDEP